MLGITVLFAISLITFIAWDGVMHMVKFWERDEYSYGYFVPFLVGFFIWQRKNELARVEFSSSWAGIALVLFGLAVLVAGELATIFTVVQYGYVIALHGVVFALIGWQGYRIVMVPLALLFFAVPLPNFLYNNLSAELQLISSQIGVWVIRQFGISVYLEGNVIQLVEMQLQVVEACSGLRYLFPLTAVSFMIAYIYRAPMWKRVVVFLSAIPITVLMNSLRIGLVGVSVEYWGKEMAEGILHDFEGWVIFMSSLGLILLEMLLLNLIGKPRPRFDEVFYIELPGPMPKGVSFKSLPLSAPLIAVVLLVLVGSLLPVVAPERPETIPERPDFTAFPSRLGQWRGDVDQLDQIYIDALKLDDYLLADYRSPNGARINLYSAYYGSQRSGVSAHSPRTCLPGDGWKMTEFDQHTVDGVEVNGQPLRVNRAIIRKGGASQLVYYWFQQRGRVITNEYLVKWFLLSDSITRNRTDGALIRLTTLVGEPQDISRADARLSELARYAAPQFEKFVPN